ncbi:hypothetical protein [Streptomyces endophyticus]|uniref:Uncharacterized protein n=1 Tax=Streptomyces endophyticus TaxID=714166 RepID=A0ABU6FGU9_9ACTN|nr:hypothetical protein [Streptomyces endophyticus]MEB8342703.1 hypothetical protein [Streptomyces endophyticus]
MSSKERLNSEIREAVRHHYRFAVKRFARQAPLFVALWVLFVVSDTALLIPVGLVGILGGLYCLQMLARRAGCTWMCARAFRAYEADFVPTLKKVRQEGGGVLFLLLGQERNPMWTMRAHKASRKDGWPKDIEAGLWFAGDRLFGGAAFVPGSGELLIMQPNGWKLWAPERKSAGAERIARARRAGIRRLRIRRPVRVHG